MSAKVALPIHFFTPLTIQESPSRRQVVVIPPDVAEPTRGSVRPNEPIFSKRIIGGSQRCFCSSSPQRYIEPAARPVCTPQNVAIDESTRANSMAMKPLSNMLPPALPYPPYPIPPIPRVANLGIISRGNLSRAQ